jgi:hypothetical protein
MKKINPSATADFSFTPSSAFHQESYIGNMLGMSDGYSELVVNIMQDAGRVLLEVDRAVHDMSPEGIEMLAKILIMIKYQIN